MTALRPSALDFARLLQTRQELEDRGRAYLAALQTEIKPALERRGYHEVHVKPSAAGCSRANAAADTLLVVVARLPLQALKSPTFRVQLPLVVTYSGRLIVEGAQINKFTVDEPFGQSLALEGAQMAELLVQFLSDRYMEHLLRLGLPAG
ncbi:hypothetical protein [Deinococcus budaensis]|uniref:Uncharacterized protein n=1 Tax=Deinococcus budaensis TaxID=1665626 RepID=A0A7W8GCZ7_9DEIO|nr:hypothetical protein [Deinococcus budaensis]MBB5233277.1 hypothetical protein [Deinococcus budaensis]